MSKNSTRTTNKTIPKNEPQPRRATKSPATSVTPTATTTAARSSKLKVKQQDSVEGERSLKKTTKIATSNASATATTSKSTTPTSSKKSLTLHTNNNSNKERQAGGSKRTTPSPTTKTTSTSRASKQPPATAGIKAKPNAVLDTYHSVTVSSPPSKRRAQPKQQEEQLQPPRVRTFSRTLQPDEIVVLKRESAKQRSELEVQQQQLQVKEFKQPVAFEVNFEVAAKKQAQESDNYSDDFESYESDFETDASTPEDDDEDEEQAVADEDEDEDEDVDEPEEAEKPIAEEYNDDDDGDEEDSEPTQNPITVIQRDKDLDRKLDSGHYDMHSRQRQRSGTQQPDDSFDTNSMANSDQLDSGISSYGLAPALERSTANVHYGGYEEFVSRPVISKRGLELMRKLRFDHLDYQLFEMKPLSYEGYMQSYGKLNTCQLATQTHAQHIDMECQTVEVHTRTSWTQHPPHYGGQLVLSCSGFAANEADKLKAIENADAFETSLERLEQLHLADQQRVMQQQRQRLSKPNDFERLGIFLHKASLLLSKVLNAPSANEPKRQVSLLQTGLLNALSVRRIFASAGQQQLVVTVHECPPQTNVYRDDFANLLMVWSLTDTNKPLRLLSTWAEVCRVAFSSEAPNIIVAGLRDGSVAMWDLRETHSYCSKLDGHLTHFAATQSVVPSLQDTTVLDLGAVVDVRSFRPAAKTATMNLGSSLTLPHKDIQYATLNDSGLLTIWTLVESGRGGGPQGTNEYSSPWARVKLLQAAICDLRGYLERRLLKRNQSAYEKTKSLFQGNVYSDELLRELNETQTLTASLADQGLQGLRFSGIDAGSQLIYVCTNRNFVLCCTRSLKTERFTRIGLHESRFLFPTALCVLANENFVAVGLSNGSVMILNCNQRQRQRLQRPITAMPPAALAPSPDPETGKSCAIQNIILNERRSFEQQHLESSSSNFGYDTRPNTALQLLRQPLRAYEQRVFDQQLLLSGTALRQHLVQALVQSSDGWKLFALSNGSVRCYDFHLDRELTDLGLEVQSPVTDIAAASSSTIAQHLLVLEAGGQVKMHTLNL
ncbi:uncharacterized protein LOC117567901 [Drosophila albomicans]|uniref:Uncharacterized protein LOC117567901 n=1 Tax=Drosophila albomicans TaxID=7291 RepID=A0A6P8WZI6_DROAB|nr:uncharacterized protein LOC117567901 [Drosophila albomicans]